MAEDVRETLGLREDIIINSSVPLESSVTMVNCCSFITFSRAKATRKMPKIRTTRTKPPPEGYEDIA